MDIEASRVFYEKLRFIAFGGNQAQNWLIMKNGAHLIGLFQGVFDRNTLTFNPGWDQDGHDTASFTDVRELQDQLKAQGVDILTEPMSPQAARRAFSSPTLTATPSSLISTARRVLLPWR